MSASSSLRSILPVSVKPVTYMNVELIKAAVDKLDSSHHEYDVGRAVLSILRNYFPQNQGWTIVPEFLVPEKKRPDYCIEKFAGGVSPFFTPKVFVEMKSGTGATTEKALDQITSSMVQAIDRLGGEFTCFLIIVKGKQIGFFEYHNDRSNLSEDEVQQHFGAISFNNPQQLTPNRRPFYRGTGSVSHQDDHIGDDMGDQHEVFLDLATEDLTVVKVLEWMRDNQPLATPRG